MSATILSPHLDDAVLSCWHLLDGPGEVVVINVFAGSPASGKPAAWWDQLTGADDSIERMRERVAEDRDALALAGRVATGLGLLDDQYRGAPTSTGDVRDAIAPHLHANTTLFAPAAMTGHPDHVLVRDAAIALAREGWALSLYADLPHAIREGWPTWVTGEPDPEGADVDEAWTTALAIAGLPVDRLVARVRPLDAEARARKFRAVTAYRTQRTALDDVGFVPLGDDRALSWEAGWDVPPSALGGPPQSRRENVVADALGEISGDPR